MLPREVTERLLQARVIVPQGKRWDDLFQHGPRPSGDFMVERAQPAVEEREPL